MSGVAIGLATGAAVASSSNSGNSSAKKTYYCNQIMPEFNAKTATVEQKQDYADCVDHFYPSMTPADIIAVKVMIIAAFISFVIASVYFFKEDGLIGVLPAALFPMLVGIFLFLTYIGFKFVFFG